MLRRFQQSPRLSLRTSRGRQAELIVMGVGGAGAVVTYLDSFRRDRTARGHRGALPGPDNSVLTSITNGSSGQDMSLEVRIWRTRAMNHIARVVRHYIIRGCVHEGGQREVTETTPLTSSGLVDSLSMVNLLRFLEKKYAIHIPDSAATPAAFDTIEHIVALVRRCQEEQLHSVQSCRAPR